MKSNARACMPLCSSSGAFGHDFAQHLVRMHVKNPNGKTAEIQRKVSTVQGFVAVINALNVLFWTHLATKEAPMERHRVVVAVGFFWDPGC